VEAVAVAMEAQTARTETALSAHNREAAAMMMQDATATKASKSVAKMMQATEAACKHAAKEKRTEATLSTCRSTCHPELIEEELGAFRERTSRNEPAHHAVVATIGRDVLAWSEVQFAYVVTSPRYAACT
jgi:hypothetical protein